MFARYSEECHSVHVSLLIFRSKPSCEHFDKWQGLQDRECEKSHARMRATPNHERSRCTPAQSDNRKNHGLFAVRSNRPSSTA